MKEIVRTTYIDSLLRLRDKPIIKVITGLRRVGKSVLLRQYMEQLQSTGVNGESLIYINKESLDFDFLRNYKDLYEYVNKQRTSGKGKSYIFIDEVQEIEEWERAVSSFFADTEDDIYITGSNAYLLSSDLSTLLSGRYIEIPIYPLSFKEFESFYGDRFEAIGEVFSYYLRFGGMPGILHLDSDERTIQQYLQAIYHTIIVKDIVQRFNVRNTTLLENITHFIMDNIGNLVSAKRMSDYFKSQRRPVSVDTVLNYLDYLRHSYIVERVKRYDIKGKKHLETADKFFLGDIGIRHAIIGYREKDIGGWLENLVFLELRRRGYVVTIGKYEDKEIDFVAERDTIPIYIQVAYLLESEETVSREVSPLLGIPDNYPKYIISMDTHVSRDFGGIIRLSLIDFLLEREELQ